MTSTDSGAESKIHTGQANGCVLMNSLYGIKTSGNKPLMQGMEATVSREWKEAAPILMARAVWMRSSSSCL
jgi:hypothetical protein